MLVSPNNIKSFCIKVNSSNFATRAVLSQQLEADSKWHLVVFFSKSLSLVKQNYEIYNKKILVIIYALEKQRYFLEGAASPVEIWTDYKNLKYFMAAKKLNYYQAQQSLYLARFDFLLYHRPERSMEKSNTLSRQSDYSTRALDNQEIVLLYLEFF